MLGHDRGGTVDPRSTGPDSFLIDADTVDEAINFFFINLVDLSYVSFWAYGNGVEVN